MFRTLAVSFATVLALGSAAAAERDPEAQLAKAVAGRTEGEPVRCIRLRDIRSTQVIDRTAIVYTVGSTVYVNKPAGAAFLRSDAVLVTDTHSSELCDIDTVKLLDSGTRMLLGSVGLSKFVPYTKPKDGAK
jgi:hypothetical protein